MHINECMAHELSDDVDRVCDGVQGHATKTTEMAMERNRFQTAFESRRKERDGRETL